MKSSDFHLYNEKEGHLNIQWMRDYSPFPQHEQIIIILICIIININIILLYIRLYIIL